MVDIASRALSPRITTRPRPSRPRQIHRAVLHRAQRLDPGRVRAKHGTPVLYPTPGGRTSWPAVSEVRLFGSGSIQIRGDSTRCSSISSSRCRSRGERAAQEWPSCAGRWGERGYDEAESRQLAHTRGSTRLGGLPSAVPTARDSGERHVAGVAVARWIASISDRPRTASGDTARRRRAGALAWRRRRGPYEDDGRRRPAAGDVRAARSRSSRQAHVEHHAAGGTRARSRGILGRGERSTVIPRSQDACRARAAGSVVVDDETSGLTTLREVLSQRPRSPLIDPLDFVSRDVALWGLVVVRCFRQADRSRMRTQVGHRIRLHLLHHPARGS